MTALPEVIVTLLSLMLLFEITALALLLLTVKLTSSSELSSKMTLPAENTIVTLLISESEMVNFEAESVLKTQLWASGILP